MFAFHPNVFVLLYGPFILNIESGSAEPFVCNVLSLLSSKVLLTLMFHVGYNFVCRFWKMYLSNILCLPMDLYIIFENVRFTHRS